MILFELQELARRAPEYIMRRSWEDLALCIHRPSLQKWPFKKFLHSVMRGWASIQLDTG